ncbi:MAG: tryptophanase [Deltaproteobacteria bacterium]|nr:tryptophanase [Deltaproteobacteria bacterium]
MKTIIEPFRIKAVEPIRMTTRAERERILSTAKYNPFKIAARDILIDLLTDSGTGAMSAEQWAAIMRGDESYAGSESWFRFEKVVRALTGFKHIIPTHQGRAAERILFSTLNVRGKIVVSNHHFDTTRANVAAAGGEPIDLPCAESRDTAEPHPFKGNIDTAALETRLKTRAGNVALIIVTVTDNTAGGQPVSLANLRAVRKLATEHGVPLFLDAARFAENAWLIRKRESGQAGRSVRGIAHEMFSLADGCTMSAKKDGLANIGGFLALNDDRLAALERDVLILTEGFPTYGGLAGRDLDAIAVGLDEVLDEDYLRYRFASTAYLARACRNVGFPIVEPPGGHAVYIDARTALPHIAPAALPGQALVCELYLAGGIRACEIGTLMFGDAATHDLVRLAIPRRVYTQSHIDYVGEVIADVAERRNALRGYRILREPATLRHFTAELAPM